MARRREVNISAIGTVTILGNNGGIVGFAEDTVIADRVYVVNTVINPVILPEPIADDFTGTAEYFLTPLPAGLTFHAATRTLSGRPTALTTTPAILTYTARNFGITLDGSRFYSISTFESTSASLTFSVTVVTSGVGSVTHYSDAAAATPITDVVPGGDVYSVVVFGANVTNLNADDPTARPAIAYTLGTDDEVQFDIVAYTAALENGDCRAVSDTDTSRYTCRYSVADSVAATDPGVYSVSVSDATDEGSDTTLAAYNADAGVTIGVRPTVKSVKFYPDLAAAIAATGEITGGVIGDIIYTVILFSENMENINGQTGLAGSNGLPRIRVWTADPASTAPPVGESFIVYTILAHDAELRANSCRATSATETSEYLCQFDLAGGAREYIRVEVLQESRDLAGHTLADDDSTPNFPLTNPLPPRVDSITHYADVAQTMPISGTVLGGEIYSRVEFTTSAGIDPSDARIFYHLGLAPPVQFRTGEGTPPPGSCHRFEGVGFARNTQYLCRYPVGAADEGQYRVSVGALTVDKVGQALNTEDSVEDSGVTISALRFATGADIADQVYAVGQSVALSLPTATGGLTPLTYTLTPIPAGLTFSDDGAIRLLTGTPTAVTAAAVSLTYTATDSAGLVATLTFMVTVNIAPTFAGTIAAQTYTVGQPVPVSLSLPTAAGGLTPLTYTLTPIPAGLSFSDDGTTRLLTGTPTSATATAASLIYTATDTAGVADTLTFMVTVNAAPTFDVSVIPLPATAYTYIANRPFTVTLPPASGGTTPLSYTLTPASSIPTGLSFDADASPRTLSGSTSIVTATATALTYTATDANGVAITAVFSISGGFSPATVTSVSAAAGTYSNANGDSVLITIAFTEAVAIFGPLQLTLTTGNSLGDGTANYTSGEGSAELTFTYTVRAGDNTDDLAYTGPTALSGTILNAAGNIAATLTLPAVGTAGSLSASSAVVLDNTAPVFPAPGDATTSSAPLIRTVATGSTTATVVYDAAATDNGGAADAGITYALLSVGNHTLFSLDDTGVLTPTQTLAGAATYSATITATDAFGNVATQYLRIVVAALPVVEISDTITGTANLADGTLTFTISFSEDVTGFTDGITVTGGSREPLLSPPPNAGDTYTRTDSFALVVTPLPNTNTGRLTITVPANAATAVAGSGRQNLAASHTQDYDTMAPAMPSIDVISQDGFINRFERLTGVNGVEGGVESGARVALCFDGDLTDSVATCTGGTMGTPANTSATTWRYELINSIIDTLGEGDHVVRAVAIDAAGNPSEPASEPASRPFTVDLTLPDAPTFDDITGPDNVITAAEKAAGVTLTGRVSEPVLDLRICFGGSNSNCSSGTVRAIGDGDDITVAGNDWSYEMVEADFNFIGQGETSVRARITDVAENDGINGPPHRFTVDTTVPVFSSGDIGVVAVGATSATVPAYDATATDNGGGVDDGITYTLSGDNANLFNFVAATGIVTYNAVQNFVTTFPHHRIVITATDTVGNTATQAVTIEVRDAAAVIITDSVAGDYAGIADGDLTFTFTFSEPIESGGVSGGFALDDISVTGGTAAAMLTTITNDVRYTLVVTPDPDTNDRAVTVTVRADAVTGTTTDAGNPLTMLSQNVDNVAPMFAATNDVGHVYRQRPGHHRSL